MDSYRTTEYDDCAFYIRHIVFHELMLQGNIMFWHPIQNWFTQIWISKTIKGKYNIYIYMAIERDKKQLVTSFHFCAIYIKNNAQYTWWIYTVLI